MVALGVLLMSPWGVPLVLAPVLEETVFRAGLQETLLRRAGHHAGAASVINLITAGAFGAAHAIHHPYVWAASTLFPAVLIGAIYQRDRRLAPCIALHALLNAVWIVGAPMALAA